MFLDIIAVSLEDVVLINQTQASRIELCSHLEAGGFTPDYALIKNSCEVSKIPVRVMVRHKDGSYSLDEQEMQALLADIDFIKTNKAEGIVFGSLTLNNEINLDQLKQVIARANPLKVTFHRAIDEVKDQVEQIRLLSEQGIDTVLTRGGTKDVLENIEHLNNLTKLYPNTRILIGKGVNSKAINQLKSVGLNSFHLGSYVRENNSFLSAIDVNLINRITN